MASVRPEQAAALAQTDKEHLAAAGYRRYQNALKAAGAIDFDDLLLLTEELFERFPAVRREEAGRFDHLLVDEYQDTNGSQYRIVQALAAGHRNLCVVGDDDQSIYGWRGAEVTHILRFNHDWPDAKVVRLETNYRSTREILDSANRLIVFNKLRHAKVLRATSRGEPPRILQLEDEQTEAKTVVEEIQERIRAERRHARDFAILFRTNEQPRSFEIELRRAKVPYILVGGMSFYDRKEVRDVLAYLKLLVNPRDEVSLLRIINTPPRGIGQGTVTRLLEKAVAAGKPLWEVLTQTAHRGEVPAAAVRGIEQLSALVSKYRAAAEHRPPRANRPRSGRRDRLPRGDREALCRRQRAAGALDQHRRGRQRRDPLRPARKSPRLSEFLQELTVTNFEDQREKESQLQRDAVALMTLHAAKGLEFSEVYMVGMEEGLLPHHRSLDAEGAAIDEERRLCYVGVTRAQRRLTLSMALSRMKWGKPRPTLPSRFLYELTGQADNPNYHASIAGKPRGVKSSPPAGGPHGAHPTRQPSTTQPNSRDPIRVQAVPSGPHREVESGFALSACPAA